MLVAVPHDRRVALLSDVARACEEHHIVCAVFLDRLAVYLCPEHRPLIVELCWVSVVEHAVYREILSEVCHPALDTNIQHVLLDQNVLYVFHGVRICEIDHAGVKRSRLDVIHASVFAGDKVAVVSALVVHIAVFYKIRIYIREELDATRIESLDDLR